MLSPVRKKYIALLNLSSQCIVFTEKCIFVPHEKKTIVCCLQEKKIFWLRKVQKKKVTSTMKIPATPPIVCPAILMTIYIVYNASCKWSSSNHLFFLPSYWQTSGSFVQVYFWHSVNTHIWTSLLFIYFPE